MQSRAEQSELMEQKEQKKNGRAKKNVQINSAGETGIVKQMQRQRDRQRHHGTVCVFI